MKHLGDGLMVVFGSASAAVSCAVAMQQARRTRRSPTRAPDRLAGRVERGRGRSHEDDDYFGEPVIEAARLCDRCESGQVLAADIVRIDGGPSQPPRLSSARPADAEGSARSGRGRRGVVGTSRRRRRRGRWCHFPARLARASGSRCRGPTARADGRVGCAQARRCG